MAQKKRSQRKRSKKKSQRKMSGGEPWRGWIEKGDSLFNWYKKIDKSSCEKIAKSLLYYKNGNIRKNKYEDHVEYIYDYGDAIEDKSGIFLKGARLLKSGFATLFSTSSVFFIYVLYDLSVRSGRDITYKRDNPTKNMVREAGYIAIPLAIIAGVAYGNISDKKKQSKMILQTACDVWNNAYPEKKITISDIKTIIKSDRLGKKIMKDISKAKPSDIKKAEKHERLHYKK